MKKINRFFWWCGGATIRILDDPEMDIEHARFFASGATILFTAIMASFSGGYAFFIVFDSIPFAVFFGLFWGGMIFNFDRYMVITIGKGDGKSGISWPEFRKAILRIVMAVILGIVIATPLELKLFQGEIQRQIEKKQELDKVNTYDETLSHFENDLEYYESRINDLRIKISNGEKELKKANQKWIEADSIRIAEWEGHGESQMQGDGPIYKAKEKIATDLKENYLYIKRTWETEKANLYNQIEKYEHKKETLLNKIQEDLRDYNTAEDNNDGLVAQLQALKSLPTKWAKLLIMALFIIIEIAPVFFKLMHKEGPYDHKLETERYIIQAHEKKKLFEGEQKLYT